MLNYQRVIFHKDGATNPASNSLLPFSPIWQNSDNSPTGKLQFGDDSRVHSPSLNSDVTTWGHDPIHPDAMEKKKMVLNPIKILWNPIVPMINDHW